jgi:hypothetical protein
VRPFDVRVGPLTMNVSGSNGIDQTMDFLLGLEVPRSAMGARADQVVASLVAQTARTGLQIQPSDVLRLGARLTGTVTDPSVSVDLREVTASAARGVERALVQEAERRVEAVEQRFDAAADEAQRRAEAELARLVAEAEQRAETIRVEAQALAETVRREGNQQADALLERPTSAAGRVAARAAADRLRREAEETAARIVREADARADALVAEARHRPPDPPAQ